MPTDKNLLKNLGKLLVSSIADKTKVHQVCLGSPSSKLIAAADKYGVDLTDTIIYVDSSSITHSLKRHGIKSKTVKHGAIPICPFDIMFLPQLIESGKVIGSSSDTITIEKKNIGVIGDIVCEIRISNRKGKRLYLKTMYNIKKGS